MRTRLACAALASIAAAACTDTSSATDLNPEGPPMIRQVRLKERVVTATMTELEDTVFAFGTHEQAAPEDVHAVERAVATGNKLRIIMDELLVGNSLEELACRDGSFSRIPVGANPDDIARCSVPNDVLPSSCPASGRYSVCICQDPAGCTRPFVVGCPTNLAATTVAQGQPIGTLDCNQDGSPDAMRLIEGSVRIQCGSISVPISATASFWNPSGTQNRPVVSGALDGFDMLGPAIVLVPNGPLPTNISCGLAFAPDVVDKQGIQVCAPPNGDIAQDCSPGDVAAFSFGVEPLSIKSPSPSTNVPRNLAVTFAINAPLDLNTLAGIQISPQPPGAVTITTPQDAAIRIEVAGGWAATTEYTVTFPVTITDTFARPLPEARTYRFTTGS